MEYLLLLPIRFVFSGRQIANGRMDAFVLIDEFDEATDLCIGVGKVFIVREIDLESTLHCRVCPVSGSTPFPPTPLLNDASECE